MDATTIRSDTTARHVSKYDNPNPIHQLSLGRFYGAVAAEITARQPQTVLDFGCGEGFILDQMAKRDVDLPHYEGVDLRSDALGFAKTRHPDRTFTKANIFDVGFDGRQFDMVMALEVLEHLYEPEQALKRLVSLTGQTLLLTVPNEPWFQLMNLIRGRDLIRLGNHPEHVQHWNRNTFTDFVGQFATVTEAKTRFPFVILVAKPK